MRVIGIETIKNLPVFICIPIASIVENTRDVMMLNDGGLATFINGPTNLEKLIALRDFPRLAIHLLNYVYKQMTIKHMRVTKMFPMLAIGKIYNQFSIWRTSR